MAKFSVTCKPSKDGNVDMKFELPLSGFSVDQAETSMVRVMQAVNAQLDHSDSRYRLVAYDTVAKQYVDAYVD